MYEENHKYQDLLALLQRANMRLEFAEKIAKLGYWEIDIKHKKIYWSAEIYNILQIDTSESSSKRNLLKNKIFPEDIPLYKEKLYSLIKYHKPIEGILRLQHKDKAITYCQFRAAFQEKENKISGTLQDITTTIEVHKALENAKLKSETAAKAKSYFLAQASHDLRQPMQALGLFISSLKDEHPLTSKQQKLIMKIEESVNNLRYLLDNLLDISRLDSGGIICKKQVADIGVLFHRLNLEFSELALVHNISFECKPCHYAIETDILLLERILRNLLSNAFKFAKSHVKLGCVVCNDNLEVYVSDDGVGIKTEEQNKIFEEFYQTQEGQKKSGSSGLGLTIVQKMADLLGIKINLYSEVNVGSRFSFSLPLYKPN